MGLYRPSGLSLKFDRTYYKVLEWFKLEGGFMKVSNKQNVNKELLKKREVIEEINRHQWIESEKAGHDIGFDQASEDWLQRFSQAWMDYHMPKRTSSEKKS